MVIHRAGGRKSLWKTHHKEQGRRERLYIANKAGGMGFAELLWRLKTSGFSTGSEAAKRPGFSYLRIMCSQVWTFLAYPGIIRERISMRSLV